MRGEIGVNEWRHTWNVKIVVKTPKGIIPVGEVVFDSKGDIIEVPTKETLLSILKTKLTNYNSIAGLSGRGTSWGGIVSL